MDNTPQNEQSFIRLTFNPWLWLVMLTTFVLLAWLSVAAYRGYNLRTFDLGAISQAIWQGMRGVPLVYTHMGVPLSRLAEHVEIVYFLLVPVYALRPSPETLLILQALLYTLGALPVYALARRRLGSSWPALLLAVVYLFYPVGQTAVLFEFHADTLAAPLLMFAIEAADRRHWKSYWVWLFLALASKFYVSVPVTMMGLLFWRRGERRMGRWTVAAGIGWFFFSFGLVRALFAPAQDAANLKATPGSYFAFYFGQVAVIGRSTLSRLQVGVLVYAPSLFLGIFAWDWLVAAGSIVLPVLMSNGPGPAYHYIFHHYALAVPFLLAAVIYGAETRMKREAAVPGKRFFSWQLWVGLTLLLTLALNFMFVDIPRSPAYYRLVLQEKGRTVEWDSSVYQITRRDAMKSDWLDRVIPEDAAVAATRLLAAHLINRSELYLTRPLEKPLVELLPTLDYVAVDALFDYDASTVVQIDDGVDWDWETVALLQQSPGWQLLQMRDGLLLFGREGDGLMQAVVVETAVTDPPLLAQFEDAIGLAGCDVAKAAGDKWQITCEWAALRPLTQDPQYFAVTRIDGVENGRVVHLPTLTLYPTSEWEEGQLIRETFEFTLPEDMTPGQYALYTGWYDSSHPQAFATDADGRLAREYQTGIIEIAP